MSSTDAADTSSIPRDIRGDARDNRLSLKQHKEEALRKTLLLEARELCTDISKEFASCAKENGMKVVFNCQKQNKAMIDCINVHYNEKKFEELLVSHGFDVSNRTPKSYRL